MHGELPKQKHKAPSRARRFLVTGLVLVATAVALFYVFGTPTPKTRHAGRYATSGPAPVLATNVARADVPVYLTAVGTVQAFNTVTVSPQVDGKIVSIDFNEGQDVKKGQLLARIDPTIYQAQYDQALAKKAQDEAQLANAKNDLARYQKLAAINAINKQQTDTQAALVAQDEALIKADNAAIENAKATLGYTAITAPIAGRTGIRQVDVGNIVRVSSSPAIVTITQLKPISVIFNLPQQELDRVNTAFAKGPLAVDALKPSDNSVIERGKLTVINNAVDSSTGTVKLKAEFPNDKIQLWPGQFVNVRLLIDTLKNVAVVPTAAVQRGPEGPFVYVIKPDNTVAMQTIAIEKQGEAQTVIKSGVAPPARVVTTGFARLTDGAKVTVGSANPPAAKPAGAQPKTSRQSGAAEARESRRRGGGQRKTDPAQ